MRMTSTKIVPQIQRHQMDPLAVRRAIQHCSLVGTEMSTSKASRIQSNRPRAPEEAQRAKSPVGSPMGTRAHKESLRENVQAQTPSQGNLAELVLHSPMSSWLHWRTSSSLQGTYLCVSVLTWHFRSPSLKHRSRSGSRTAGQSGRNRTLVLTLLLPLVQLAMGEE